MFHLRQLACARALARHRHFGRAADAIGITQSGLTQSIARLEAHYGVRLFDRDRNGVTPTAFGEVLLEGAADVLERLDEVERRIRLMDDLESGELSVAADPMLASSVLAPAFAALVESHPNLRVRMRSGAFDEMAAAVEGGEVDLYVGFPHPRIGPRLEVRSLSFAAPRVVMAPDHPLLEMDAPQLSDFLSYPLVQGPVAHWYLDWAADQLAASGSDLDPATRYFLNTDDAGMLSAIIRRSRALMAAMWEDVRLAVRAGELAERAPPAWPTRVPGVIVTAAHRTTAPAADRLADVIIATAERSLAEQEAGSDE